MGVLGLYSYFESRSLGQRKNWSSSRSNSAPHTENILAKQRYFILDGNAFIHHLYCGGPFEWIWGGQYSAFANHLTAHVRALEHAGFRLHFLFDGPLPLQKLQTRLTRDTEKIRKMTRVVNDLEHYYHGYSGMPGSSHSLYDQPKQHLAYGITGTSNSGAAGGGAGRSNSQFLIPPLVMEVTVQTLRSLGVDLTVCDGEADGLVAQLAMEKSLDPTIEEAYAVSKDSDYFIYNTGSSSKGGYIPLDSLFVQVDPESQETTIAATVYSQSAIAEHLGIRPEFLPLFASLTGNDYLRPEVFEDQIAKALSAATGQQLSSASNTNHTRIRATASFLKEYGAGPANVIKDAAVVATSKSVDQILESILDDRRTLYATEGEERLQELRSLLEESMSQYSLVPDSFSSQESISTVSPADSLSTASSPAVTRSATPMSASVATAQTENTNWLAASEAMSRQPSVWEISGMDRMKEAFHAGQFSYKLMDVVCNKMFWCTPFLEDTERESAWLASRELRRWIYGILFRNLLKEESKMNSLTLTTPPQGSTDDESGGYDSTARDVVEYVRRGDHLSAETVTGASDLELDSMLEKAQQLQADQIAIRGPMTPLADDISSMMVDANKTGKTVRRVSVMDVDLEEDLGVPVSRDSLSQTTVEDKNPEMETEESSMDSCVETGDMSSRTNIFLGILGSDTALVRALPRPFMVLAATLRYLVNALAHSKTRSASISVANFEVIAFVATALFIQEKYHPESIASYQQQQTSRNIPTTTPAASVPLAATNTHPVATFEAPPMTKRSLHLSTQYQHVLGTVSLLANALYLEDMIPQMASLFDGLLFQQTLALARGGTLVEQRFQFPESMALFEEILAAVEEGFIDSGEIDVVVLFRPNNNKKRTRSLGIFGPEMDVLNPQAGLSSNASQSSEKGLSSSATGNTLKASKSGIQKKSSGTKKRSKGAGGGNSSSRNGGGSGGGNMFSVLSLGCEF
ncbi:hypothetical protein BGZ93_008521 [Podila epicladia]|nr:hypothetical protein BGZ92_004332 [Podila epicladia]KAG0092049.1 hypothetical protein BGZ93_008521 [Podila epicladia]